MAKKQGGKEASGDVPLLPLLTVAELCKVLKISRPTMYTLIGQGLPVIRFGKALRFSSVSVERWVARREEIA